MHSGSGRFRGNLLMVNAREDDWARTRFPSYSGEVMRTFPVDKADDPIKPIPFAYAAMAGLNELVLVNFEQDPPVEIDKIEIGLATFRRQVAGQRRWLGSDAQFNATIGQFAKSGYLKQKNNRIRVRKKMLDCLRAHAQTIFSFMLQSDAGSLEAISDTDWLRFNEHVFAKFFFHDYGERWRALRAQLNERLGQANRVPRNGKTARSNTVDYISRDPQLWVAFNTVAIGGPGTARECFGSYVDSHKLNNLAPTAGPVEKAANLLVASGVLTLTGNPRTGTYDVADDLRELTAAYRAAIDEGLRRIHIGCVALKDKVR
jgi:hypothetical protein